MLIELPLSYNLTDDDLVLNHVSLGMSDEELITNILDYFAVNWNFLGTDAGSEMLERVMRHAIILFHKQKGKKGTFAQCLETALIWEVG